MYVNSPSKALNHLERVEHNVKEDATTGFYSKTREAYREVFVKVLDILDFFVGTFPELQDELEDYQFKNAEIKNTSHQNKLRKKSSQSSSKQSTKKCEYHYSGPCSSDCYPAERAGFYSPGSPVYGYSMPVYPVGYPCYVYQPPSNVPPQYCWPPSAPSYPYTSFDSNNQRDYSYPFDCDSKINVHRRSSDSTEVNVDGSDGRFEMYENAENVDSHQVVPSMSDMVDQLDQLFDFDMAAADRLSESDNNVKSNSEKPSYSSTNDLGRCLENKDIDRKFEEHIWDIACSDAGRERPVDFESVIESGIDVLNYKLIPGDSRNLCNVFDVLSHHNSIVNSDVRLISEWLDTVYVEHERPVNDVNYFDPSGVPGKIISYILSDTYYVSIECPRRVRDEFNSWKHRYSKSYKWSAPKCTSAKELKKLDWYPDDITNAYKRWIKICTLFNVECIKMGSHMRLQPSQFIKKVRSLRIMKDEDLYSLFEDDLS